MQKHRRQAPCERKTDSTAGRRN